jgi:hypothetical protein
MLLDISYPQLEEGIDCQAMGLKWYQRLVSPLRYYPAMHDCNHAKELPTISLSVLPTNHKISIPPPSPDMCKMLPPPTSPTKQKERENDWSKIEVLLMNLAENESKDGTSISA